MFINFYVTLLIPRDTKTLLYIADEKFYALNRNSNNLEACFKAEPECRGTQVWPQVKALRGEGRGKTGQAKQNKAANNPHSTDTLAKASSSTSMVGKPSLRPSQLCFYCFL